MAQNDELDLLLQDSRLTDPEWLALAEVLGVKDALPSDPEARRHLINQELRHSYGHTIANLLREWWEPDYPEIVRATAQKLKLPVRDHHTVEDLEQRIVLEIIDRAKAEIIKKKGPEEWARIEREVEAEIDRLIREAKLLPTVIEQLKTIRGAGVAAALVAGRLAGFALYIVMNQFFFAIARWLGIRVGVAVAGPIIGHTLKILLGPAGWIVTAVLLVYDLGNTSWKKVIPAVVLVASLRGRLRFEGTDTAGTHDSRPG
jgi:uncharacterized protein YaaW (UPF0174 family)